MNFVKNEYVSPAAEIVEIETENEFMSGGSVDGIIEQCSIEDEEWN